MQNNDTYAIRVNRPHNSSFQTSQYTYKVTQDLLELFFEKFKKVDGYWFEILVFPAQKSTSTMTTAQFFSILTEGQNNE